MMFNDYTLLSPQEAADLLGCGMNMMYTLLKNKQIKAVRMGRLWKVPRQAILDYIVTSSSMQTPVW